MACTRMLFKAKLSNKIMISCPHICDALAAALSQIYVCRAGCTSSRIVDLIYCKARAIFCELNSQCRVVVMFTH
jgi:hypothetical protein